MVTSTVLVVLLLIFNCSIEKKELSTYLNEYKDLCENRVDIKANKLVNYDWIMNIETEDSSQTLNECLIRACIKGDPQTVKHLINKGANPSCRDIFDRTPLMYAAKFGHTDVVKYLCSLKIDVNEKREISISWSSSRWPFLDIECGTALQESAQNGDTCVMRILLSHGADIKVRSALDNTPLFYAAQEGNAAMVELLLKQGLDVDSVNFCNETALSYAVRAARSDVVDMLTKWKKPNSNTFAGAICAAIDSNDIFMVVKLLKAGASCDSFYYHWKDYRYSPLVYAAQKGRIEIAKLLLRAGAKMNGTVNHPATPLAVAAQEGDSAMVRFLLENGANANLPANSSANPLSAAFSGRSLDVIRQIVEHGANAESMRSIFHRLFGCMEFSGSDPAILCYIITVAAESLHTDLRSPAFLDSFYQAATRYGTPARVASSFQCLEEKGISLDYDKLGITKLMAYAASGRLENVQKEIGDNSPRNIFREISINKSVRNGWTALSFAILGGNLETVRYIVENGAEINLTLDFSYKRRASPLELAISIKRVDIVEFLMSKGAEFPFKNIGDMTPSDLINQYILNESRYIKTENIPLLLALELAGYFDLFYQVAGRDSTLLSNDYQAAFLIAASRGETGVAKFLIDSIPGLKDELFTGSFGEASFTMAADFGHLSILNLLVENTNPTAGWKPMLPYALRLAERYGKRDISNFLLKLKYGNKEISVLK
jgi:ankyrin repeat protein